MKKNNPEIFYFYNELFCYFSSNCVANFFKQIDPWITIYAESDSCGIKSIKMISFKVWKENLSEKMCYEIDFQIFIAKKIKNRRECVFLKISIYTKPSAKNVHH